ncbi:hypothetical protein ScPMuIL_012331 [Solemya velum]
MKPTPTIQMRQLAEQEQEDTRLLCRTFSECTEPSSIGNHRSERNKMPSLAKGHFLLVYGSQTGQAQAIAEEIAERSPEFGLEPVLVCLSQTDKKFSIEREKCVVFVVSTTGDGDPPETASKFVRRLKKRTHSDSYLSHLSFALLGLGDSNYSNFCNCGKSLDRRLEELGAKRFYDSAWGDDAVGLEIIVEPWLDGLFPAIQKFLGVTPSNSQNQVPDSENTEYMEGGTTQCDKQVSNDRTTEISRTADNVDGAVTNGHVIKQNEEVSSNSILDFDANPNPSTSLQSEKFINLQTDTQTKTSFQPEAVVSTSTNTDTEKGTSLPVCSFPLSESSLTLPMLSSSFLILKFFPDETLDLECIPLQNGCKFPSSSSDVSMATVCSARTLTRHDAVKKTLCLTLDLHESGIQYEPGDALSVICPNDEKEVDHLLTRLGVQDECELTCRLEVRTDTKKKNASVPGHLPITSTLRHLISTCVDIREPPKKALLRSLVEYTPDPTEKQRLQELCSKQGAETYTKLIREPSLSILDIFLAFPSCRPPVDRLLEHLPRLQPRPYSICSSFLVEPCTVELVFNIIEIPEGGVHGYSRQGVCTGWLDRITRGRQHSCESDLPSDIADLTLQDPPKIHIFGRSNQYFRLPDDLSVPIVLIGPGTGVAPFIGFLQQRRVLRAKLADQESYGDTWLFYGCRHRDKDYLFRTELERFTEEKILSRLCVSFSRENQESGTPKYVQDSLALHAKEIVELIDDKSAIVYVCGDAKNMSKSVMDTFIQMLHQIKGLSVNDARAYVMTMKLHKRYKEDVWT